MSSFSSRFLAAFVLLAPLLPACSIPQYEPSKAQQAIPLNQQIENGHYRRVIREVAATTPENPTPAQAARRDFLLSRAELGLQHPEEAMQLIEKALAIDPKNASFHVQAAAVAGRLAGHASVFKQLSYAKRAKKELDEAIALDPMNADSLYGLMMYSNLAPPFLGGDKALAQKLAEQLTTIDPPRGYRMEAFLAHDRKDAAQEEALLRKAVAAGPKSYEAHIAYAMFVRKTEPARSEQVDQLACKALDLDATRADAWRILTEQAAAKGQADEVTNLIALEQKFNPEDLSPAYFAAVELINEGKHFDLARGLLKRYLEKPPEGEAPSAGLARYQLALISEKEGHAAEALGLMRLALNEDPTLDQAKRDIKRLEKTHTE